MVFVLDDIAKIESDRKFIPALEEVHIHTQASNDMIRDGKIIDKVIYDILESYVNYANIHVWGKESIGTLGVFTDAFLNAGIWGNNNTPGKNITTTIRYGLFGSVIFIEDEGQDFDYQSRIDKLQSGESHEYQRNGGGMKKFNDTHLHIAYHGKGNLISIATKVFSSDEVIEFNTTPK